LFSIHDDHVGGIPEAGLRMPGHAFYCGLLGEEILLVTAIKADASDAKSPAVDSQSLGKNTEISI